MLGHELRNSIFQPLEERVMLDIGGANSLPPTIVVGRTLSAYDVPDVQNNQETITLTVYDQAADPITGVLLTDTLENGVTFASASQLPDQNGQQLAWSLGTIQPYDRASVTFTVSLTNPIPTQLDTGGSAYGTLDAGMVSWTTAPATLRSTAIAANLLASTPDANTTDPYVQEKAAELNYDPTQIYNFLQTQIGYNSYVGSLRGARGTLWSNAGNALDDASLGVALMRASGVPAQYEEGTLSTAQAQPLILSMFPASYQTVGYIPPGTQTADPANDPQLLSETKDHFWFQFDAGSGMKDADPEFAGQAIGQAATTSTGNFTEVPDSLRQKTEVSLTAETYSQAAALFGLSSGLSDTVVLDQTFNDVDLVGIPLSIGNIVSAEGTSAIFSDTTFTYSPYIRLGNGATPDQDAIIRGTDYQENYTNIAFGSQILTGLFLNVSLESAEANGQRQDTTVSKTLFDRIGFAQRQSGASISLNLPSTPVSALSALDITTLDVSGETQSIAALNNQDSLLSGLTTQERQLISNVGGPNASVNDLTVLTQKEIIETNSLLGASFLNDSNMAASGMAAPLLSQAYYDSPRVVAVSSTVASDSTDLSAQLTYAIDILRDTPRVVVAPNQSSTMGQTFQFVLGFSDSVIEGNVLQPFQAASGTQVSSAMATFLAETNAGPAEVLDSQPDLTELGALAISAEAKARITAAINAGMVIVVPTTALQQNGVSTVAWLQLDPTSGNVVAVTEQGTHGASDYAAADLIAEDAAVAAFRGASSAAATSAAEGAATDGGLLVIETAEQEAIEAGLAKQEIKDYVLQKLFDYDHNSIRFILQHIPGNNIGNFVRYVFRPTFAARINWMAEIIQKEPPLSDVLAQRVPETPTGSRVSSSVAMASNLKPGQVTGTTNTSEVQTSGALSALWQGTSETAFEASSISSSSATVTNSRGQIIGTGNAGFSATGATLVAVSGTNRYSVVGNGSLSFYGPGESSVGVSGNWQSYSATVTGSVSMTLTTASLTLNGTLLPAGTYTITTDSALLSGSGTTSAPNFAASASVTTSGATVLLGPGAGNLTVGGMSTNATGAATLTGYNGTIDVAGNGNGTDTATLNGNSANVVTVAPSPASLTTDQNTAVSFNANVQTSFADTYDVTAEAPKGWTVTIDSTGKVTVTPAAGTQSGTYPIQVVARSGANSALVAQATVEITVTPTAPGMKLAVTPDTLITVPFNGAELPSAFDATLENTGPAADTYTLSFSDVPTGFAILNSGASLTVPAGQTGIVGIYLQPTGTQLPPPGTDLSFTVTATSATNPAITQTVNVSFTMPTIEAVTLASNPASLTSTPGSPTTATVTITNVGNVPADAALSTATDSGLTASGLPSTPVSVGVGQSVTETVTLTAAANATLNSTLTATVTAGPAATQDTVSVVSVSAAAVAAAGTQASSSGTAGATSFAAGETLDVTADILAGVLQPRQALASFTIKNSSGTTVFTSTPVTITLGALPADNPVDLGTVTTTGLAAGQYTINVAVTETGGQAIAGATGTGGLLISSPIAAGLSVDAEQVSPGTNTVTSTLTVANQPLLGSLPTDGTASSVAVKGTLAYVAGTKDINVVDISDPAKPQVVGTFGSGKLSSSGTNLVQISGNDLLVATQDQSNSNAFDVLVYTLADPKNPQLAGSVTVPYRFLTAMTVEGTTAYFATHGILSDPSSGSISDQFGDVAAVDFSNPASPAFLGVLFNDRGSPDGHSGIDWGITPITNGLAYVVGSTSTGADTQTGQGRLLVVDTSNPASMSVTKELDLPGTVHALAVAVDGNTALVVGSSGGLLSPFGDASNGQLTGNVTLTLLDISNPADPTIIGSTVATQDMLSTAGEMPNGAVQAVALGNGRFAINGTLLNGAFVVLAVDASTPGNLAISTFAVNSPVTGLAAAGGELLATSAGGLQVLQSNALADTSVTAEVDVPNTGATIDLNSFSTPPTQIVPGANSTALIWQLNLAPGDSQQITWRSTTSDLLAGEIEQVATGASVQFAESGTNDSIALPALNVVAIEAPQSVQIPLLVRSAQTVAISQASVDAGSAGNSQLAGTLSELSDTISQFQAAPTDANLLSRTQLLLNNLSPELAADPALAPFVAQLAPLQADAKNGDVTDLLAAMPTFFQNVDAVLAAEASEQFTVSVSPNEVDLPALANQQKNLSVTLTDTGPDPVTLTLGTGTLPNGVTAHLGQTQITLQPGASQTVPLTLTSNLVSTHIFTLDVKATDSTDSALATISHDGTAIVAVRAAAADVLGVTINPISVTNAGTPIAVSASIFNTANASRSLLAHITVLDSNNNVVASPPDVPISLTPVSSAVNFNLGNVDTTGLANGVYSLEVSLRATDGSALPGKGSEAPFLVGIPITATVSPSPSTLPPGTSNVTTTITVSNTDPPSGQTPLVNQSSGNTTPQSNDTNNGNTNTPGSTGGNTTPPTNVTQTPSPTPQFQFASPPVDPPPTPPVFNPPAGDDVKWIGATSGNWNVAANWLDTTTNTNHVPDATDNVTIDAAGLTITANSNGNLAQSLIVKAGSTLAIAGGSLAASNGIEIDGTLSFSAGTLIAGGGLVNTGSVPWSGGNLSLDGADAFNTGTMTLSNNVGLISTNGANTGNLKGSFFNEGNVVQTSGGFYLSDSVTLNNTSLGTWQFAGDAGIFPGSYTQAVVNSGLFQKTSGTGNSDIQVSLTNTGGTFEADSGTFRLTSPGDSFTGGAFNAQSGGTVWINTGTNGMTFSGTFTGTGAGTVLIEGGSIDLAGDTSFDFSPGLFQWYDSTVNLRGYALVNSGSMSLGLAAQGTSETIASTDPGNNPLGGTFENDGTLTLQGATTLYLYDQVLLDNPATGSLLFAGDGDVVVGSNTPSLASAGTIEKTSGTGTSRIAVTFNYTGGPLKVDSGTITLDTAGQIASASLTVATGATLDLSGGGTGNVFSGTFTGTGGGTVLLQNGSIVVGSAGATFDFPSGMFQWTGGGINLDGHTLTNAGSITLANANNVPIFANDNFQGKNDTNLGGTFNNTATIVEQGAGSLGFYDSIVFNNQASGTYTFASDAGIYWGNGSVLPTNAGLIQKTSGTGTSAIGVALSNSGTIEVDSGTISLQGNGGVSTGGVFKVASGSTLVLAGSGTNGDAFTGTYTGSGGGTVTIGNGSIDIGTGGATFNFPAGMFQWTSGGINLNGNTLTNAGFMTIANANGVPLYGSGTFPGGPQTGGNQGGTLDNQGTFDAQGLAAVDLYDSVILKNEAGASLHLSGGASLIYENDSSAVNNAGTLTVNSGGTTTISAPFTNSGTVSDLGGELDFSRTVTNSGTIDAQANTIKLSSVAQNSGLLETEGGTLTFDQNSTFDNNGTLQVNGGTATFSGSIKQDVNGYLSGGTWIASGGGTITLPTNSNIKFNEGQIVLNGAGSTITGIQPLVTNDGALTLTSGATFTTAGNFTNAGTLTVGPDSTLSITGNYAQLATATLDAQLGGAPATGHYGQLVASGVATFAGMLRSEFVEGYAPAVGDDFTVATYASTSGSFGAIDLAETPTVAYSADVGSSSLVLTSQAATLAPTQTTVTSSAPNGANYGQLVEYTATVTSQSGTPTGSVQFQVDGLNSGSPVTLAGGQTTLTVALPAGTHSISAFYISGNLQFSNSDDGASPLIQVINAATVAPSSIELYFTTYGGPSSVDKVAVSLAPSSLTLGTPTPIVQNLPADGLIFLPNGDLLTADGPASEVNPTTGAVTTESLVSGEHLALDPGGKFVWTSPQPGALYKLPIDPLGPATQETLTGDDTTVTQLAFDNAGQAFYVSSGPGGFGSFGLIDLTTFTTQRVYNNLASAHGISYDPFTGDLFLVGATSVTQIDPRTLKIVSELDFPGSGFTFDQGANDGKGHLYAADNSGHLLVVDYSATGLIGDARNFVATPFLATDLDDVAPLSGLGGAGIPVTVTHQLPATGYNVNPTSITPNPSSFSSTDVTWNTTFTPGQPETDQFQLSGQVTDMAPGEVRQVSDGTTVTATVTASDGTQIPVSIDLPPVTVAAQHIIELTPPTQTVDQGATATYTVELSNPLPTAETYTLSIDGLPAGENATLATGVAVPAGQTVDVPLTISVPLGALPGMQAFLVSAQTLEGASDSVEGQLTVSPDVVTSSLAVNLSLTPTQAVAGQTNPAVYTLTVTNTGDTTDTYNLSADLPPGFTGTFSQTTIAVPPGIGNFRDVQFSVTPPSGATAQDYPFIVTATSATDGSVSSQATGTATVLAQGVQVQLTPSSAVPGSTYQLKVTNTGQAADTFNLSLASPGALVATLGTNSVTLEPGASQTVPITTTAANFADAGTLPLTGIATSQSNNSVQAQSTANLSVPSTQSMTAAFSPSQQTLAVPGQTSFLLQVNNTGNTEDSYSATIVGTTGPITAKLVGLDGQPTQSVPLFALPGLSSGAILLQVNDTGTDQGTVTVLVQSLSNSSIQTATTATITVGSPTTTTATLSLTNNTGLPLAEGSTVTLTSGMLQTTDSDGSVAAANIVYTVTAAPTQGSLLLNGQPLAASGTFTQDDINSGRLAYKASEEGADAFSFSVAASAAQTISGTFLIATSDPAVVATGGFTFTASEGGASAVQTVATFTDPGGFEPQASYSAEIDWGDGTSSAGVVILPAQGQSTATVTGQHTYTEQGDYSVHITLHHEGAPTATATSTAVVSDPAVAATGGFTYSATEGSAASVQTVAVFTDPGGAEPAGDYSATIDWGDGTSTAAGVVTLDAATHIFTVSGQHGYSQDGTYSVKVSLTHESAPAVTVTSVAQIANASSSGGGGIAAQGLTVTGNEFTTLTSVAVATFTDGDGSLPAADFSATIDWGDGTTSAGSITLSSGTYTVSGSHEYTDEGHYTAKVSVDQTAGPTTTGATSATVSAAATIHEQLLVNGAVGTPNQKWVQEVYRDLFGRQAEMQGLDYWVAELTQGVPRSEVAHEMVQVASFEEFQHDTVAALYQQYLGRAPDATGEAYWAAYLYNGGTIAAMSQALVSSPEFYARGGGTVDGFLTTLFQDALGRSIDASALAYFQRQMAQGATAADVAAAVFASDEYHRVRVNALFEQLLDRPADAGALDYYAAELDDGAVEELVVTQLISSDEYFNRVQV